MSGRGLTVASVGIALGLGLCAANNTSANGGRVKIREYEKKISYGPAGGQLELTCFMDSVMFQLCTVDNRYRVLRIRVRNESSDPLQLSKKADSCLIFIGDTLINGILNLCDVDSTFTDSLDPAIRSAIAYPLRVEAGEEESIYVFVPRSAQEDPLTDIELIIAALPSQRIHFRDITTAKKK